MENKRAIQEKPCQKRSMNLKFTAETRLVPWASAAQSQFQHGLQCGSAQRQGAAPWTCWSLELQLEPCSGIHPGVEMACTAEALGQLQASLKGRNVESL